MSNSMHNEDYQLLLSVLREFRGNSGYTQEQIAEKVGTPQNLISKCERAGRRIDPVEMAELAEAMDVAPETLYGEFLKRRIPGLHPKLRRDPSTDESSDEP